MAGRSKGFEVLAFVSLKLWFILLVRIVLSDSKFSTYGRLRKGDGETRDEGFSVLGLLSAGSVVCNFFFLIKISFYFAC